ncbi:hypothetical protein [Neisseria shayeganii]|uniref:Uncharacterized protein n=1 Tax=Neisseria shayeganii TaxID=607712 RepID=A0A7D7SR16_9NEIS|nr:hypothetical protein [Neisseria shayeganii]QMT41530.1 hypothetical protein H3L94_05790 [Neisseria shayeganii]
MGLIERKNAEKQFCGLASWVFLILFDAVLSCVANRRVLWAFEGSACMAKRFDAMCTLFKDSALPLFEQIN